MVTQLSKMAGPVRFDGKVVLVTGAGGGLYHFYFIIVMLLAA